MTGGRCMSSQIGTVVAKSTELPKTYERKTNFETGRYWQHIKNLHVMLMMSSIYQKFGCAKVAHGSTGEKNLKRFLNRMGTRAHQGSKWDWTFLFANQVLWFTVHTRYLSLHNTNVCGTAWFSDYHVCDAIISTKDHKLYNENYFISDCASKTDEEYFINISHV